LQSSDPDSDLLKSQSVGVFDYLIGYLFEVGPVQGGEFRKAISYVEIEAWSRLTHIELDWDEVLMLRALSFAYLEGLSLGEDPNSFSPRVKKISEDKRKQVSKELGSRLRFMAKSNGKRRKKNK